MTRSCRGSFSLLSLLWLLPASAFGADAPSPVLFPAAFSVEHQLVQTDASGDAFRAQPVVDTYGGTALVSVRPGGSRVIVDFAKRTVTEVRVEKSTYWTLSFSQMGDLARRLAKADERPSTSSARAPSAAVRPDIRVAEVADSGRDAFAAPSGLAGRAAARHYRAWVESGPSADVWVDGTVRLSAAALDALESFERDALGSGAGSVVSPAQLVAAARRAAGGAIPVRVKRAISPAGGTADDVVTSLTPLAAFPQKLLAIGDGFRRVASPLEEMVAFAEDEASRDSSRLVK
ncbi:MAG TPA: hypothetical protein VMN04_06895 [Thermoanaerobaculia bacterium]|nr:hypothetical protein [Thermoanaerobaculia bacterium]